MSTMSLPPQPRMRGSGGRGQGRFNNSYHNSAALSSIPGGYRQPGAAAPRPMMQPASNSNRPPLIPAPPMMYYTGAGPMIGHPNSFPRALPTGAGAAAQSHLPAGSILPAHSSVAAQVQQNSGLTNPQLYQMQLAGAAPHYPGLHPPLFQTAPSTQYNIKPQQHMYPPQTHQPQQHTPQSQPKKRGSSAIKIINPDTNSEIDLTPGQSTSSGVSSASSSTTRLSDHADTQRQSSESENPIAREFKEKVHGSMKHAPNAIIKSPTEVQAPASAIDQSSDSLTVADTTGQVVGELPAVKAPAPLLNEIPTSQSSALPKQIVDKDKLTEDASIVPPSQPSVPAEQVKPEPTPAEVQVSEPDRSAEQPTAAFSPEVTQSTRGDSTVGAALTDSDDFDRQPQSDSPVTSCVAVDSNSSKPRAPSPSPDSSSSQQIVDSEPASLQKQSPDSLSQTTPPESHTSPAHSPEPTSLNMTLQEHPPQMSSGLLPTPSSSSDLEKSAAVLEPVSTPEYPATADKDNVTAGSVEQESLKVADATDKRASVEIPLDEDLKPRERQEETPSDQPRSSDSKVTGIRKQEPQLKPDTLYQVEADSEPEVEELVVNGDSEDSSGKEDSRKSYTYDRDELLSFRKYDHAPKELFKAECFRSQKDSSLQQPFGREVTGGRPKRINQGPSRKIIAHQPGKEEKVELRKAENKWVRHSETEKEKDKEIPDEDKETAEIFRKFQGILNKLTPQKFKDLAEQALKLPLLTVERLKGCIDKIFTKALQEPNFSVAYANLCRVMSPIKVSWVTEDGKDQSTSFRRELLTKCQKEFEKDKKDDEEKEKMLKAIEDAETPELKQQRQASLEVWETVARRRSLGNIRFIGELFKLKMLSESIMHDCIVRLLRSSSDEESIECFCKLIITTGKDLDHPKGKQLMNKYFTRIEEIIGKKKVSARIKFMLQDVQETRRNEWIARRQESLKTIDQIHREAKQEQQEEQEMIKLMNIHTHPSLAKPGRGESGDKRRGGKSSGTSGQDEWRGKGESRRQEPQKVDVNRLPSFLRKGGGNKDNPREAAALAPNSNLRPSGWNRKPVTPTPPPEQPKQSDKQGSSKGPQRSSSGGTKRSSGVMGRGSQQGPKRTVSGGSGAPRSGSPVVGSRSEKESALSLVKQLSQPHQDQDQTHQEPEQPQQQLVRDKCDEDTITRQSHTIVDELTNNRDVKEALACVEEMESPNLMNVLVRECIFHALEKTEQTREVAGELIHNLLVNKFLLQEQVSQGLFEVLEISDDLAVDIPLFWDYFAVCVFEMVEKSSYSLDILARTVMKACDKAPKCVAKVLACCAKQSSPDDTSKLWVQSGLTWATLGLQDSTAVEDLLESEGLRFLRPSPAAKLSSSIDDPPYLPELVKILRTSKSDDATMNWIKERFSKEECETPRFVNALTRGIITVSTTSEQELILDKFRQMSLLLKKHVDENDSLQIEILYAAQVTMFKLGHPRGLLTFIFNNLYDVEVVKESTFHEWREQDIELPGRGVALQSVKPFFEWLEQADLESDEGGT